MENRDNQPFKRSQPISIPTTRTPFRQGHASRFSILDAFIPDDEDARQIEPEDNTSNTPEILELFASTPKDLVVFNSSLISPKHEKIIEIVKSFSDFEKLLCSFANENDLYGFIKACQRFSTTYLNNQNGFGEGSEVHNQIMVLKDKNTFGFQIAYSAGNYKLLEVISLILNNDNLTSRLCKFNDPNIGISSSSEKLPRESVSDYYIQAQRPLINRCKSLRKFFELGYNLEETFKMLELYKLFHNLRLISKTSQESLPMEIRIIIGLQAETILSNECIESIRLLAWPESRFFIRPEHSGNPRTPDNTPSSLTMQNSWFEKFSKKSSSLIASINNFFGGASSNSLDYSVKGMVESREKTIEKVLSAVPNKSRLDHAKLER